MSFFELSCANDWIFAQVFFTKRKSQFQLNFSSAFVIPPEVLQSKLPISGISVFKMLLDNARAPDIKLWALSTPYETKDKLKERGYYWDSERRTWYITISNADLEKEAAWLQTEVYANHTFKIEHEKMNAYNRFSMRCGEAEVVNY